MAYLTYTDLKTYLNVTGAVDNTLLTTLITAAQKAVESYTRRVFEVGSDAIRYYTVGEDTHGSTLMLDRDLCTITSVITNLDGTPITLSTADYMTRPRNNTPYFAIVILGSSGRYWQYTHNPENGVKITGKWAYSATAPADIVQATTRLAGYMYRQRDAQVFDVTATEFGLIIPSGIPKDVVALLDPYRRAAL